AAIRLNPAMLYLHRGYDVGAGYFWPAAGRPFYKVSVIDGVTSRAVAGFEYTGFSENMKDRNRSDIVGDSPVLKRGSVAIAIPTDYFAIGFSGHYVEAEDRTDPANPEVYKGISLGAGVVAMLGNQMRLGLSIENFNNRRVADVAPKTARLGLAWEDKTQTVTIHGEVRQRDRAVNLEWNNPIVDGLALAQSEVDDSPERMALGGVQIRTFDMLRLFAGYGRTIRGESREVTGAGIGIYQKNFSFSYATSKQDPEAKDWQSSLHLSVSMKI
ncbi:MAG TPA: hypothetical protein VE954_02665, partial [Oligoflexus sp.]|uniref:hypothetical protein n=1 Tax=Oligoflexus sp. TaxID=1971216 RepID=UPI002D37D852